MTTVPESLAAMVAALEPLTGEIPGLQVCGYPNPVPTPPSIDMYPDDPFQEGAGMGVRSKRVRWVVRARVATGDPQAAFMLLLRFLDVTDPASVEAALQNSDPPADVGDDGSVSGFVRFGDDAAPDIIGAQWRVGMYL